MAHRKDGERPAPPVTTQQLHPVRAALRTAIALAIGAIPVGTLLIRELGLDSIPFFATLLGIGSGITRVMATPAAIMFMDKWLPWLNPAPRDEATQPPNTTP